MSATAADVVASPRPDPQQDPPTAQDAANQADWWCRYALDRIDGDGRLYDPRFRSRLMAATAQLQPAVTLGKPEQDQIREAE